MSLYRPIILALLLAAPAAGQRPPAQILVQVWSFGFSPRPILLRAGQPVTLTFVNGSGNGHDFTAREFFASSRILAGAAPDGEVELGGHQNSKHHFGAAPRRLSRALQPFPARADGNERLDRGPMTG